MRRSRAHVVAVPRAVGAREDARRADRAIAYEIAVADAPMLSAEQWARATWEDAPKLLRGSQTLGWRFVLGLGLAPGPSSGSVLGWRVTDDRPETVTLQADSALIAAHNVVIVEGSTLIWTTLVRYERRVAIPIWRLAELVHRILLPYTLARAVRRVSGA